MSSIGLIFREDRELSALPEDWIPESLGSRLSVAQALEECLTLAKKPLSLSLRLEGKEESEEPRTISVSGVWGENELALIKSVCERLSARFDDAESGEFVEI
ncbi:hypothetical protein [Undibacterium danionis]|uniref:Uncharacterized protein n=1 Tax=Undibacterium danionis TaxID=1812100 RepID=A0ABV6IH81_9BURK